MNYQDIRYGIRNALATIPAIQAGSPPQGKVFWEWTAPADTPKPWLEMELDGDIPSLNSCAYHIGLEVLCFGDMGSIHNLDPIADAVVTLLNDQPILTPAGRYLRPKYLRDSRFPSFVNQLNASVIRLKFIIPTDLY